MSWYSVPVCERAVCQITAAEKWVWRGALSRPPNSLLEKEGPVGSKHREEGERQKRRQRSSLLLEGGGGQN